MHRRSFIKKSGVIGAAAVAGGAISQGTAAAAEPTGEYVLSSGTDLSGWSLDLGDGLWTGPGEDNPSVDDLARFDLGTHSRLEANVHERGVMAHAISHVRKTDLPRQRASYAAKAQFRIPEVPSASNWDYNAQTLEAGLFVWDGEKTRYDYGIAMQWVLNPWVPEFGHIRVWTQTPSGPEWQSAGYLEPDTEWHTVALRFRVGTRRCDLRVDGQDVPVGVTYTKKHDSWSNTIDGRFQLEIISVWPGENPNVPKMHAEFRNWAWHMGAMRSLNA